MGDASRWRRTPCWPTRMQHQIYLAVLGAIAMTVLITGVIWYEWGGGNRKTAALHTFSGLVIDTLRDAAADPAKEAGTIADWARRTDSSIALYDRDLHLQVAGGREVPGPPPAASPESGWFGSFDSSYARRLPDERWLVLRVDSKAQRNFAALRFVVFLLLLAFAVACASYPVVRRITRRLELLQRSVEDLGQGNLKSRVPLSGADEVGSLAQSFNGAAARIESLVNAQKSLLANASHELRSPLARIRMAVSFLGQADDSAAIAEIRNSTAELDQLVGEILLASRLDAGHLPSFTQFELLDFTALVAEECSVAGAEFSGEHLYVHGDAILLRRLVRNLLENANRHGAGTPIEASLRQAEGCTELIVSDRGPGISADERERVFEPFYRAAGRRERDGGVGLGLALVRSIAGEHGGQAFCRPREGGGCCFHFRVATQAHAHLPDMELAPLD